MISHYIEHTVLPQCPDSRGLLKIVPHLAKQYILRNELLFDDTKLNGSYVCFIYPLNRPMSRGVGALLNKVIASNADVGLFKERTHY